VRPLAKEGQEGRWVAVLILGPTLSRGTSHSFVALMAHY